MECAYIDGHPCYVLVSPLLCREYLLLTICANQQVRVRSSRQFQDWSRQLALCNWLSQRPANYHVTQPIKKIVQGATAAHDSEQQGMQVVDRE